MQYIQIIKLVLQLLPLIIDAIKALEKAIPEAGQGSVKLDIIRGTLEAAYDTATDVVAPFEQVWPVLQKVVASVVKALNKLGKF